MDRTELKTELLKIAGGRLEVAAEFLSWIDGKPLLKGGDLPNVAAALGVKNEQGNWPSPTPSPSTTDLRSALQIAIGCLEEHAHRGRKADRAAIEYARLVLSRAEAPAK